MLVTGLVCLCASLSNCGGIVDSLCSRKGGREREVQAIEKGRTLGPSHRERKNATEAQFVVDVVKRIV